MMPLPKIEVPTHELTLPSTQTQIKYRPFLVKEEKILLMALESEDDREIMKAITNIISNCLIDTNLKPESLPSFDLEYVFLKLRSSSIGEISELSFTCKNCEAENLYKINLSEIEISTNENHTNDIKLTDNLSVIMKYPTARSMSQQETTGLESVFEMMEDCVDSIYNDEEVFDLADYSSDEKREFFDGLRQDQFENIQEFFTTMPKLETIVDFDCIKCKTNNNQTIEGLQNFFG